MYGHFLLSPSLYGEYVFNTSNSLYKHRSCAKILPFRTMQWILSAYEQVSKVSSTQKVIKNVLQHIQIFLGGQANKIQMTEVGLTCMYRNCSHICKYLVIWTYFSCFCSMEFDIK